jgi:hypothetical protein
VAELVPVELGGPGLVLQLGVADVAVVLTEKMKLKICRNGVTIDGEIRK